MKVNTTGWWLYGMTLALELIGAAARFALIWVIFKIITFLIYIIAIINLDIGENEP